MNNFVDLAQKHEARTLFLFLPVLNIKILLFHCTLFMNEENNNLNLLHYLPILNEVKVYHKFRAVLNQHSKSNDKNS